MRAFVNDDPTTWRGRMAEAFTQFSITWTILDTDFVMTVKAVSALRSNDTVAKVLGNHVC